MEVNGTKGVHLRQTQIAPDRRGRTGAFGRARRPGINQNADAMRSARVWRASYGHGELFGNIWYNGLFIAS